jgi:superoxide dismutase, Cu-Zn family
MAGPKLNHSRQVREMRGIRTGRWAPLTALLFAAVATGCAAAGGRASGGVAEEIAEGTLRVRFVDARGVETGTALLTEVANGVRIDADLHGLQPGERAIHIHERGHCRPPDFASAGAHLDVSGRQHGFGNPAGAHLGDLPNLRVGPNGVARYSAVAPNLTLRRGTHALLRPGGTSLVVHAGADDYRSDPSGESGARIACASIAG